MPGVGLVSHNRKRRYRLRKIEFEAEQKRMDFWGFQARYRPLINYETEYSYLKFPLQVILRGEREVNFCKGSQIGVSEALITYVFYMLVIVQNNIFYMLPTRDDASDFSAARINTVIQGVPDFESLFAYDNVGHKRFKQSNLYLRGSNSLSKLKTVAVDKLIKDEYDEMSPEGLAIVDERLSGSKHKQEISVSTPTLPDVGIYNKCKHSNLYELFIPCPTCKFPQVLDFDGLLGHGQNISVKNRSLICQHCKSSWSHAQKLDSI